MIIELTERVQQGRSLTVDARRGTIGPVRCLGWLSSNNREYRPDGVAAALYEGVRVNNGHARPGTERPPSDTIGWLEGCAKTATGVYAERLCLLDPSGPLERRIMAAAERAPWLFSLSHVCQGRFAPGSSTIVESVLSVSSVDLVQEGATNPAGLLESRGHAAAAAGGPSLLGPTRGLGRWLGVACGLRESRRSNLAHAVAERLARNGGAARARLFLEAVEAGLSGPDPLADAAAGVTEPMTAEQSKRRKLAKALAAVLRDDSLSLESAVRKAAELLDDPDSIPDEDEPNEWDGPREESVTFHPARVTQRDVDLAEADRRRRERAGRAVCTVPPLPDAQALGRWLRR